MVSFRESIRKGFYRNLRSILLPLAIVSFHSENFRSETSCQPALQYKVVSVPTPLLVNGIDYKPSSTGLLVTDVQRYIQHAATIVQRVFFLCYTLSPIIVYFTLSTLTNNMSSQEYYWTKILSCIESSGACLTKFAQWISTRPDLFPIEICNRLRRLQYQTSHHDTSITIKLIKQTGWPIDLGDCEHVNIIGSGCVAQVVKGYIDYKNERVPVAVKVIHPSIRSSIIADLGVLRAVCKIIDALPGIQIFSICESVEEFASLMTSQLDLVAEADNLTKFRENFSRKTQAEHIFVDIFEFFGLRKKFNDCEFPKPMYPYVSTGILVESYMEGTVMTDIVLSKDTELKRKLAKIGLKAILKMVFEDNFIHAGKKFTHNRHIYLILMYYCPLDLHPGNIIVQEVGDQYRLCFIDTGIVVELNHRDRINFIDLFYAIARNEGDAAGNLMVKRSASRKCVDQEGFAREMNDIVSQIHQSGLSLNTSGIGVLLQKLLVSCYNHQVKLESKFSSVLIAIGVIEGLGRQLDENLDILQNAMPYIVKASAQQKIKEIMPGKNAEATHN
jgi:aarF domain-containing kinase